MSEKKSSSNRFSCLIMFTLLISILAWITYGTLEGVFGMLSYIIVGFIAVFPWIIPFIGIPLGILDLLGYFDFGIYELSLKIAHLESSWLSLVWYWVILLISIIINIMAMIKIISWLKRSRKKEPKKNLALINCNIIDGSRDSKIITNGVILIQNIIKDKEKEISGLIVGVGRASEIEVPSDYKKINLNGCYVLPGLINAHCHLFGSGKPTKVMQLSEHTLKKLLLLVQTPLGIALSKKSMKKHALTALNAGVTTLRSMGEFLYLDVKLRKKIEEGEIIGPRILCSGKGIHPTGGHGMLGFEVDSTAEIRKAVRRNIREEVDGIKILSTGGVMDARMVGEAGRPQMTIQEIETACFEAHRGKLLIATHCESTEGMREALLGGVDTIEHGAEIIDELVPLFKNNPKSLRGYTAVVPTISAGMGLATFPIKVTKITQIKHENAKLIEIGMIKALQRAYNEGIRFGVGTDASVPYVPHYEVWKELKYLIKYTGMSPQEAIYFATQNNAEIIGVGNITGSIEIGKFADIQVVPGNPLENIDYLGQVSKVLIKGYLIKNPKVKKIKKLKEIEPLEL